MTGNPCLVLSSAAIHGAAPIPLRRIQRPAFCVLMLLLWFGCAPLPAPTPDATVRYVQIREAVSPQDLYASVGDEVRWQNLRPAPVKLSILGSKALDSATCGKGFARFGLLQDFVKIDPGKYVSLCFSQPGVVRYNIWLDADNPRGEITPTGRIHLDAAS